MMSEGSEFQTNGTEYRLVSNSTHNKLTTPLQRVVYLQHGCGNCCKQNDVTVNPQYTGRVTVTTIARIAGQLKRPGPLSFAPAPLDSDKKNGADVGLIWAFCSLFYPVCNWFVLLCIIC